MKANQYQWAVAKKPIMGVVKEGDLIAVKNGTQVNTTKGLQNSYFVAYSKDNSSGLLTGATSESFTRLGNGSIDALTENALHAQGINGESIKGAQYAEQIRTQYNILIMRGQK